MLATYARQFAILLVAGFLMGGCGALDYGLEQSERSIQPLPSRLKSEMREKDMAEGAPILLRLYKQESELEVWKKDKTGRFALLKTYPICRWSGKLGPKKAKGDRQAPEGFYTVSYGQMNPDSRYYLSFNLGFPNRLEAALGYSGEALMIHGACSSSGCYAVTDKAAAEIYTIAREAFRGGQTAFQVQAMPFRMTPVNFARHRDNPNMAFWKTLKEGSDHFDITRLEPKVGVCGGRYVFNAANAADLEPLAPCPVLDIDPVLASAVNAKAERDKAETDALVAVEPTVPLMAYVDGGMHPSFRAILQQYGPKKLARMTSEKAPVSRPEAALVDPYVP